MAWAGSGWYADTIVDALGTAQYTLDLDDDQYKLALYDNTITPNFGTDQSYSTSGEISGTGYSAGGSAIAAATFTVATPGGGVYAVWDGNDVQWTSSTLTGVRGGIAYADAESPKRLILGVDFGQAYQTNDGTLLVSWDSSGIGRINVISP